MKHCYGILFILFSLSATSFAQNNLLSQVVNETPSTFISIGLGINHTGILSVGVDVPLAEQISAFGDIGIGSWGWKLGIGGSYHFNNIRKGSAVSLAFYRAGGSGTQSVIITNEAGREIPTFLNPTSTINATYSYNLKLGNKGKVAFVGGYAFAITDIEKAYETNVLNAQFDDFSKQLIKLLHPNGLILGVKFLFGIGSR